MKTKDTTQKAIMRGILTGLATTLIVFGVVYVLMVSDDLLSVARFESALNITGSYFGGITTLTAAYIASKLFNDWREQKRFDILIHSVEEISNLCLEIQNFVLYELFQQEVILKEKNHRVYKLLKEKVNSTESDATEVDNLIFEIDSIIFKFNSIPTNQSFILIKHLALIQQDEFLKNYYTSIKQSYDYLINLVNILLDYKGKIILRVEQKEITLSFEDIWPNLCDKNEMTKVFKAYSESRRMYSNYYKHALN